MKLITTRLRKNPNKIKHVKPKNPKYKWREKNITHTSFGRRIGRGEIASHGGKERDVMLGGTRKIEGER